VSPDPFEDAVHIANAAARMISYWERPGAHFAYYEDTQTWLNSLFISGYDFLGPPTYVPKDGLEPLPPTGPGPWMPAPACSTWPP
jgi:hypothetical protein